MNDRIKDLALDAIVKHIAVDAWIFTDEELEKFALSIVDECTDVGSQWADGLIDSNHYTFVNKKIKRYFGVDQ